MIVEDHASWRVFPFPATRVWRINRRQRFASSCSAVKQAAVVPDHRVADLPWMPVNQFGLSGPFQKLIQQFPAFDPSPAYDGTCMGSHIIVLQFVGRIGADQFLFYRRKRSGMIGIHRGNLTPGKNVVMDASQPFDP